MSDQSVAKRVIQGIGFVLMPAASAIAYRLSYIGPIAALVVAGVGVVGGVVVSCKIGQNIDLKSQQLLDAAKITIANLPPGFVATIDDGAKRALNAFPHMDAGPITQYRWQFLGDQKLIWIRLAQPKRFPICNRRRTNIIGWYKQSGNYPTGLSSS